ncbi:feruloyl-CoA synthase [Haliscomenobacter sp.]|uniref:feruloyl-CoA synthase n=1 Tax=Haliscomenobacter sp. TaxID=2717303 RepID=UPI0035941D2E
MNLKATPFLEIPLVEVDIQREDAIDGSIRLRSRVELEPGPFRLTERLRYWAEQTPERTFIAQRNQQGEWEELNYRDTYIQVCRLASFLQNTAVSVEQPLAILSENSIEHGLMALAALHIGLPYSVVTAAYALRSTDYAKFRHVIETLTPGLVFVQNGRAFAQAIAAVCPTVQVVAVNEPESGHLLFSEVLQTPINPAIEEAYAQIKPETIAKILFTSGSTSAPKGVINTHGNISSNWRQITQTFPFFKNGGLTLIDWLPWNHTFGGNHNFGLTLYNGGTLYIDAGNPTPAGLQLTLQNLREIAPTVYFNVPKGFEELVHYLQADSELCRFFFSRLRLLFYAGAGMAQHVWDALEQLAYQTTGKRLLISTGLGMTEASPSCMFNIHYGSFSGMLGTPVPGLEMKLIPNAGKTEVRFSGPNLTPGYWRNPEATAKAFDEAGFYCTGDALKFVDENDPNAGFIFDGRISEDFKLDTGTWVSVGVLRAKFITEAQGLIQDVVITGHDRPFVGAIVFPELNFCRRLAGLKMGTRLEHIVNNPVVLAALEDLLERFGKQSTGSSTLIKRAVFADFQLSMDKGEITDKGSINQRQVLANHPDLVEKIYTNSH